MRQRQRHEEGALGVGRIEHGERIGGELGYRVMLGAGRPVGAAVAAAIERDDAAVAREARDLRLPVVRVDDRPGGEEQDLGFSAAIDLVEDPDAVALHVVGSHGIGGTRLLVPERHFRGT